MGAASSKERLVARAASKVKEEEIRTKKIKVFVAVPSPDRGVVALDVSRDDTVASVKAKLHGMLGIAPRRQRLVFACSALPDNDDTKLSDHGVTDSATIQLVVASAMVAETKEEEKITRKMNVFVVIPRPDRSPLSLEVSRDDTVASVKAKLNDMEGIHPRGQRLVFPCSALPDDDETTLADHGVVDSGTIQLVETKMNVFVRMNKTVTFLGIESSDTVESFRLRLHEQEGIPPVYQRLICGRSQLQDGRTLADYGIQNYSTLDFAVRFAPMRRRVVELDMEVTDTVGRLKERVEEAEGVSVTCQSVSYCGEVLDDRRTLADYDALQSVQVECRRHETQGATNTTMVKRHANIEVTGLVENIEKRHISVYLIGPELGAICPSSCDTDPAAY